MEVSVYRVTGVRRAVCWWAEHGAVLEAEFALAVPTEFYGAHAWAPLRGLVDAEGMKWDFKHARLVTKELRSLNEMN